MNIEVDIRSPTPAYEQIRAQIETMIGAGVLATGTQLPSIRQLAADLGLAVNTVARSYHELELAGLVVSRARHGTVVAPDVPRRLAAPDVRRRLEQAAAAYALTCQQLGVPADKALAAVQAKIRS